MKTIAKISRFAVAGVVALSGAMASAQKITYFHNDLLGSAVVATTQGPSPTVLWREGYRPYGERLLLEEASARNGIFFTSRMEDSRTELLYMGARYMDPRTGRFLGVDPAPFVEGNVHSFNRYAYANNNPLRNIDPNGMWATEAHNHFIRKFMGQFQGSLGADAEKMIAAMQRGSLDADGGPMPIRSWMQDGLHVHIHAMTSTMKGKAESRADMLAFFARQFEFFNQLTHNGTVANESGYYYLGMAMHPIMDSTSPAHAGWQEWATSDFPLHAFWPTSLETVDAARRPWATGLTVKRMNEAIRGIFDF